MSKVIFPIADLYIKTRKSNGEVDYTDEAPVKHLGLFDLEPCITASSAEAYANARVAEALAAQASGQADPMEILRNPLSPWGFLVRALRCVSGTTLMDMSKHTGKTSAELSNFEFGRASPDDRMIGKVQDFFCERGTPVARDLLVKAARAAKEQS